MKKIILVMVAFLGIITIAQAQEQARKISYGVKGGASLSTLSGDNIFEDNYREGLYGGIFAAMQLTDKLAVQPELLYAMLGGHETLKDYTTMGVNSWESTIKLRYINLPIMLKYHLWKGLSVDVGPQVGFLLDAQSEIELGSAGHVTEMTNDSMNEFFTDINFSANIGLSYALDNGLFIDGRYSIGISNIAQDENLPSFIDEIRSHFFQLGVGYTFDW